MAAVSVRCMVTALRALLRWGGGGVPGGGGDWGGGEGARAEVILKLALFRHLDDYRN